ncbi:lateral organ boundaries domain-containing protein [Cynara cardunculus var. scolymus]|uniref:Lateral organ boundaries domain-containing protein n=1 Tax=Cynara cardunculus var. scolymus TaxID=59895 RepID=A0A124SDT2_CYNCS|nr:lateral organ boundaries domain-containing protein [Cynara cardunculus var. scolymus]
MTNNHHNQNKIIHPHHHSHHHHLLPSSSTTTNRSNSSTITTTTRSPSSTITTATRSNSTTQACAACRYQRRKCAPDCILAPYFPHDRQRQFQNAHKLFGVSSITKIIRDLDPQQKDEAMRTIIYQSDVRAQDPVGGCYRIIRELQRQIEFSCAELEIVLHQLAICRAHAAQNQNQNQTHHHHDQILIDGVDCDIHLVSNPDDPHLYDDPSTVLDTDNANHQHHAGLDLDLGHIPQQQEHEDHLVHGHDHDHEQYILGQQNLNDHDDGCEDDHVVPLQEINSWAAMNNSPPSSAVCLEVKPPPLHASVDECEDFKPLLISDIPAGERHEFKFEFDEINEPRSEISSITFITSTNKS